MPGSNASVLFPTSVDLGLGDILQQQLRDEEVRKKKKLLQQAQAAGGVGNGMMGNPSSALFPGGYSV